MTTEIDAGRDSDTGPPDPAARTVRLEVSGMTCASCVGLVERAIRSVPSVVDVSVNLATGDARVTVEGAEGAEDETHGEKGPEARDAAIVGAVERSGYGARIVDSGSLPGPDLSDEEGRTARRRFLLAAAGTLPAALAMWTLPHGTLSIAIQAAGATFVLAVPGRHFFRSTIEALRHGHTTMDTLIALGAGTSYLASVAALAGLLGEGAPLFFETAAFLVTFISLGKWAEGRARGRARSALRELLDLAPPVATRLGKGPDGEPTETEVPAAELSPGDRIVVRPGERIPADGVVRRGATAVDESLLTGESLPVEKETWDEVTGGTLNESARIEVEVTAAGGRTVLAGIVRMVREAQAHPAPIQRLADRVSSVFVPTVILLAVATLVTWLLLGVGTAAALRYAVAVVVIACPCALGLATPTAILVGSGLGLRHGILIKHGAVLEALGRADLVFLDKTGTLTEGRFALVRIDPAGGIDEDALLATAAALERGSQHPLARAVVAAAEERGVSMPPLESVEETRGLGLAGTVDGRSVHAGRAEHLRDAGVDVPEAEEADDTDAVTSRILVAIDGRFAGTLHLSDTVRPEAAEVLAELREDGLETVLLTGDRPAVAAEIARATGIDRVEAGVPPGEKQEHVGRARREGRVVAMVGDGINDSPALAAADAGIAIGAGSDAAKESGGLVLVRSNLRDLARARRLARATLSKIRGNLVWAFLYNLVGLPVAAGVLAPWGVSLRPEFAGLAMALSSVCVVGNSLLLGRSEGRIFR